MPPARRAEVVVLSKSAARRERLAIAAVQASSALGVVLCAGLLLRGAYDAIDLWAFAGMFFVTAAGIEVGFHRLFTHRSFTTNRAVRALLAISGCMAGQGPVAYWVSHHRLHHLHSDAEGDPHSPGWTSDASMLQRVRGLLHAHVMWMFATKRASVGMFARDIVSDPWLRFIDRHYHMWLVAGVLLPGATNLLVTTSPSGFVTGCLFGGLGRLFVVNHVVYSINSVCHTFGSQPFATNDESRNNTLLAVPTLGQAWHNNHHAFPSSARMGLAWWQVDIGYWIIAALRRMGAAWDVFVPDTTTVRRRVRREGRRT